MNKINSMEKKVVNSKLKITKNFIYYMIAPIIILLLGIILSATVGFNWGTDFTGSSSFKIYVNNEATFENVTAYDLTDSEDYEAVYGKIKTVLKDNDLKIVSYRTSSINLMDDYRIADGQAIEVVFQNNSTDEDGINSENEALRQALIAEFEYAGYENAITSVDFTSAGSSYNWIIGILASIVFGLIAAIIYMMCRYHKSAWVSLILQVALDILLFISLLSIFRLTVNLTIGISILATFVLSIMNAFAFYSKMKENINSGKYANMKNSEMADSNIKEGLVKKLTLYLVMFVLVFILAVISVEGVREVALGLAVALLVTLFTSTFFTPAVWTIVYKEKKKK